jgi:outer membrane cobalamin receptor
VGNANLSPELSTEIDLGMERDFLDGSRLNFEVFNRDIYNIFENTLLSPGVLTPVNQGHARAQGAELIFDNRSYGASVSYLNNVLLNSNSPIPLSPRVQASAHGSLQVGLVNFTLQDTFWSDYYDQSAITGGLIDLNSWNTLDFFATADLVKDLSLKLAVLNIFDQARELTLSYPEPQRSVTVQIQGYL